MPGGEAEDVCYGAAGGSYSGVYVPLLGEAIEQGNDAGLQPHIKLEVRHRSFYRNESASTAH